MDDLRRSIGPPRPIEPLRPPGQRPPPRPQFQQSLAVRPPELPAVPQSKNLRRTESVPNTIAEYSIFDNGPSKVPPPPSKNPRTAPSSSKRTSDGQSKGGKSSFQKSDPTSPRNSKSESHGLIKNITSWSFDLLGYNEINGARTFENVCLAILRTFGTDTTLAVQEHTLRAWLNLVENAYERENPYHNAIHAADVTQAVACFLRTPRVKELLDSFDIAACLISAIVHDVHHPGMVNAALKRMGHPLSFAFKQPYLERHHVDIAFDLMENNPEGNIFRNLNPTQRRWFKKEITELVFATDMDQHMSFHTELKRAIADATVPGSKVVDMRRLKSTKYIMMTKKMLLKAADVSNTQRPTQVYVGWAERICEEFFRQADIEMSRGMPPTLPDFVRGVCSVPKTQLAFLDFLRPFVETVSGFLEMPELIANLKGNYQFFQELLKNGISSLEQVKMASKNGVADSRSRGEPWEVLI